MATRLDDLARRRIVAAELQAVRHERGLTYLTVEQRSGTAKRSLARYLQGEREIGVPLLLRLCDAMEIDPSDLLSRVQATIAAQEEAGK